MIALVFLWFSYSSCVLQPIHIKPMGGRTWKYWPASGPVLNLDIITPFPRHKSNLTSTVGTLYIPKMFSHVARKQTEKKQNTSISLWDGTVELDIVLHLNIQGNLNLEDDFFHITLTSDIIFQLLVQDAHDVYYLVLWHKECKFPWFLDEDRYFHPKTTQQRK